MIYWVKELPVGSIVLDEEGVAWQRADTGWYSASPIRTNVATPWREIKYKGISTVLISQE